MKKRHRTLAFAILAPIFLAILLGEISIYVGAYYTLRNSAYQSASHSDSIDLSLVNNAYSEANYSLLGYGVSPVIKTYEENKPSAPLTPGSAEEAAYKDAIQKSGFSQLYASCQRVLERFVTTFIGVFYEDTETNRMVLVCTSDEYQTTEESQGQSISLYLGAFFEKSSEFVEDGFYGLSIQDPTAGEVFASGVYMSEVHHPVLPDYGPYRVWLIRETKISEVYANIPSFTRNFAIVAAVVFVVLAAVTYLLLYFVVIRPTKNLSKLGNEFSSHLREGEQKDVFTASNDHRYSNEITDLNDALYTAQESIRDYSEKLRESTAKQERINADLALAERIQSSMVPNAPLSGQNFIVRGFMKPAKEVGGDLYSYFRIDDDHVAIFIGDVSGKGVGAALFMAKADTVLRMAAADCDLDQANRTLCEGNVENLFVTAFMAILELSTGKLRYVNAGHEPVFICRDGKYELLDEEPNLMLGYVDDFSYVVQKTTLKSGDRLFLYTDGVSEAMNTNGELYGRERITACLNSSLGLPSSEMLRLLTEDVEEFVGGAEQSDDYCVVALDYGEEASIEIAPGKSDLADVAPSIDVFLQDIDDESRSLIQVIADEMVSNAVYYSQSKKPIRFILCKRKGMIEGDLIDEGVPFNPLEKEPKSEDDDTPGGLGISMAKALADDILYDRIKNRNILRFYKKVSNK